MPNSCELSEKCKVNDDDKGVNDKEDGGATWRCNNGSGDYDLSDIFYTNQRKGRVFRVLLNSTGFKLQSESPAGIKEQLVNMRDIVGARCMRMQKQRKLLVCSCSKTKSRPTPVDVMATSSNLDKRSNSTSNLKTSTTDESAYLYVFAYILKKRRRRGKMWHRERAVLTLRFRSFDTYDENMREAERWYSALHWHKRQQSGGECGKTPQLLVLLNPKSGAGNARSLFLKQVTPVLNEAEVPYHLEITQHADFARDFMRSCDLPPSLGGIVAVGGDGIFCEMLNGILQRADWQTVLKNHALGIVPCGSGNGLARSIAHLYNEPFSPKPVLGAALTLISRRSVPMDVVQIQLANEVIYSCLSVGWGLISDIDIESEILRPLGYQRFTLWTLHRLVSLRTYQGRISYHVKQGYEADGAQLSSIDRNCNDFNSTGCLNYMPDDDDDNDDDARTTYGDIISMATSPRNPSHMSRCDSWLSVESHKSAYYSVSGSLYHSIFNNSSMSGTPRANFSQQNNKQTSSGSKPYVGPETREPPLHAPVPNSWQVEEGEFIMVHAAYQTHLGVDCFFAPQSKLNDGTIFLVIIRGGIRRTQLFNFLINMSKGTHLPDLCTQSDDTSSFIKVVPVTAFRIEPHDTQGIITVDGESIPCGALQAEILPGLANIMVPQ